jgi:hypothetical protein
MDRLLIKYRFQNLPYIVADGKGVFYQLPHSEKRYKPFRKLKLILNNGITEGYRINRKFISIKRLRKMSYVSSEVILIEESPRVYPF